jgi:hypothetical protein
VTDSSSVVVEDFGLPRVGIGTDVKDERTVEDACGLTVEKKVYSNIGVPLRKTEDPVENAAVMTTVKGAGASVEMEPKVFRALGRRSVYHWLKKVKDDTGVPENPLGTGLACLRCVTKCLSWTGRGYFR